MGTVLSAQVGVASAVASNCRSLSDQGTQQLTGQAGAKACDTRELQRFPERQAMQAGRLGDAGKAAKQGQRAQRRTCSSSSPSAMARVDTSARPRVAAPGPLPTNSRAHRRSRRSTSDCCDSCACCASSSSSSSASSWFRKQAQRARRACRISRGKQIIQPDACDCVNCKAY